MRFPPASKMSARKMSARKMSAWVCSSAVLWLFASPAVAQCGCVCVEGAPVTLCATLDEARLNVDACGARAPESCPVSLDAPVRQVYPSPVDGAINCREVRVHDDAGAQASRKVCDVEPAASARTTPTPGTRPGEDIA